MMSGINTEIQSAGGGMGGYGGFNNGTNPLLWLITLAFLRNGDLNGGSAAETAGVARANEGISCLADGQNTLRNQQQFDRVTAQMDASSNRTVSAVGDLSTDFNSFSRDLNMTLCNGFNDTQVRLMNNQFDLSRQMADCCCDLKTGQQATQTAIAMQTNDLLVAGNANTQRIVDLITSNKIQELESQLTAANTEIALGKQTQAILTACGCCSSGNSRSMPVPTPAK